MTPKFSLPERVWFRDNLKSDMRSILVVFYHRRSRDFRVIFRSYEEIGSFTGMSERRAKNAIKRLAQIKLLKIERPGVFILKKVGRNFTLPSPLATAVLTYKERAYLSLIWSLKDTQGDGEFAYLGLMDLARFTGENKWTVWQTLKHLVSKDLISKDRYGNFIRIKPLFPVLV